MNVLIIGLLAASLVLLGTTMFQWLWNITMPDVFGLRQIRFWVALRLLIVSGFLTSGTWIRLTLR